MEIYVSKTWLGFIGVLLFIAIFIATCLFYIAHSRTRKRYSPFIEDTLRLPGHALRKRYSEELDSFVAQYLYFLLGGLGLVFGLLFFENQFNPLIIVIFLLFLFFMLSRIWRLIEKLQRYKLGLLGEEYTGQELNLLMLSGAYVFHDIPYNAGNIDHIVIGGDRVFAIETKAFRKPQTSKGGRDAKVIFDGEKLLFPDKVSTDPIKQATSHAEFLQRSIKNRCGFDFPVYAVVALPGWYIESDAKNRNVLVVNPKRGKALKPWLGEIKNRNDRDRVVNYIASVARSVNNSSDKLDPDASKNYDFWLNPRAKGSSLD